MKDNLPNNEDSKLFIHQQGIAGKQKGRKETLVFCTPGSTAVWVNDNTKEDIAEGIGRNEYYETTGPRIRIRFFGGWDFPADLTDDPDFVKKAYESGVTMGGELKVKPKNVKSLTFAIWALKDPDRVNLDRIQIIKSWSEKGLNKEKVYDAVWFGNRKPDPKTGKLPVLDSTVVLKNSNYKNVIGDGQLNAVWADPDFDSSQPAVYYARVLEIPTLRKVEYNAIESETDTPGKFSDTVQERAWTSPICYALD